MREPSLSLKSRPVLQRRSRRRALFALLAFALVMIVSSAVYIFQSEWLPLVYRALDVTEPPSRAQALLVLGGGNYNQRSRTAGEIFSLVNPAIVTISGVKSAEDEDDKTLRDAGIPANLIYRFTNVDSTFEEAQEILAFLRARNVTSAVIVTDAFHSRRARATYSCLNTWNHDSISFRVVAADDKLTPDNWYMTTTRNYIWTEWVKSAFYVVRYGITCF